MPDTTLPQVIKDRNALIQDLINPTGEVPVATPTPTPTPQPSGLGALLARLLGVK